MGRTSPIVRYKKKLITAIATSPELVDLIPWFLSSFKYSKINYKTFSFEDNQYALALASIFWNPIITWKSKLQLKQYLTPPCEFGMLFK